jgi:hypothetical protein
MRKYQPKPPRLLAPLLPRIQPHPTAQYPPRQLLFPFRVIPSKLLLWQQIRRQVNPQEIPRVPALPIWDPCRVQQVSDSDVVLTQLTPRKGKQGLNELHVLEELCADMAACAARGVQQGDGFEGLRHLGVSGDEGAQVQPCGAEVFRAAVFDVEEVRGADAGGGDGEQGCEWPCGGLAWLCAGDGEDGQGVDLVAYEVDVVGGAEAHERGEGGAGVADACGGGMVSHVSCMRSGEW